MSENFNINENETKKDPMKSIENTVEDLKKKIETLSEEKPETFGIPKLTEEGKEKLDGAIDGIKRVAEDVTANPEVKKTVSFIKENAVKAATVAKDKFDEVTSDPNVRSKMSAAEDKLKETGLAAKVAFDKVFTDEKKEEIKQTAGKAGEMIADGAKNAYNQFNEFMAKPEVQAGLDNAKDKALETVQKGSSFVKNLLKKK